MLCWWVFVGLLDQMLWIIRGTQRKNLALHQVYSDAVLFTKYHLFFLIRISLTFGTARVLHIN